MTSVVRYVKNTTTAPNVNTAVGSTGSDYQLVAFDITTTAGIAAGANATILTWTGAGKIKSIQNVFIRNPADGEVIPMGEVDQATHTTIRINDTGKIITLSVPGGGAALDAGVVVSLLLVIGNY
jgi:phosphoribosylformylglycinamidine (FGAM) synthase-like enzyme